MQPAALYNFDSVESRSSWFVCVWAKVRSSAFYVFVVASILAVFIPFNPRMPHAGLDASWEIAMNEAVGRKLSFGSEIVFTYGPYASIGTRTFSPATDSRMMVGSALLALSYSLCLLFLARGRSRWILIVLLVFLAAFGSTELLLLSYSFLLVACTAKFLHCEARLRHDPAGRLRVAAALFMWSTLGLLPLIKGSLLLPFIAAVACSSYLFFRHSSILRGMVLLIVPFVSVSVLWVASGQSISALPRFLRETLQLTAGYTEAMSTPWGMVPPLLGCAIVLAYLAVSAGLCLSILQSRQLNLSSRWPMALFTALLLFVTFKHGFIAVANLSSVFEPVAVLALIAGFISIDRKLIASLCIAVSITIGASGMKDAVLLEQVHREFGVGTAWSGSQARTDIVKFCVKRAPGAYARTTFGSAVDTYASAWHGIGFRIVHRDELNAKFESAMSEIRRDVPLPSVKGSVDLYEFDQSPLFASGLNWDPRPVIQSYSAYTPALAWENEGHLREANSPDWVFFRLESIDGRLPSLDDGISWPALLDNYSFDSYGGRFVLLRKNQSVLPASRYQTVWSQTCKTGANVMLPGAGGLLMAEVSLKPTFAGKILTLLFSPPQLNLRIGLQNGETKTFRVVSAMMSSGFLLSPLIANTEQFAALASHSLRQGKSDVRTVSISPAYGGETFWSGTYELTLKRYMNR